VLGNLANITLFSAAIPGPEQFLAGHPLTLVTVILAQIVVTLALIDWLAARPAPGPSMSEALRTPRISEA